MMETPLSLLTVCIGEQRFGIDIAFISAILERQHATPIPQSGDAVSGLMNVRGRVVTLVNIRSCLGMAGDDRAQMNVTIEHNGEIYGLLFDAVGDIVEFMPQAIEPLPAILDERWNGMAQGIFRQPDALLIMLDPVRIVQSICPPEDRAEASA